VERAQAAVNARRNAVAALMDRVMGAAASAAAAAAAGASAGPPFSPVLMPHVLRDALAEECGRAGAECDELDELLAMVTEGVVRPPILALALRPGVGLAAYLALDGHSLRVSRLSVAEYLATKEAVAGVRLTLVEQVLGCVEIDLAPFWPRGLPSCGRPANIGRGVSFINRHLCARLMRGGGGEDGGRGKDGGGSPPRPSPVAAALHAHLSGLALGGVPLALNARLASPGALVPAVARAIAWLEGVDDATPWADIAPTLADLGFAPGWGDTAGRARETLALLDGALGAPHPADLEALLARLPGAGQTVVMVSPHGFFAQAGALGKPDTGGQVVYVLDAVRALERELADRAAAAGIGDLSPPRIIILTRLIEDAGETTCNVRREAVEGTNHAVILRVPFRNGGGVLRRWVSRFQVWPYLEQFAVDAAAEIVAELGGNAPDLVVGHYTDGGLVAGLLCRELGPTTTMAFVAHALEKTKYPQSALRWASPDLARYNFGCHFTADLINLNRADCECRFIWGWCCWWPRSWRWRCGAGRSAFRRPRPTAGPSTWSPTPTRSSGCRFGWRCRSSCPSSCSASFCG
jgi:sucrose synthase